MSIEHKFFKVDLDLSKEELDGVYKFVLNMEQWMLDGKFPGISSEEAQEVNTKHPGSLLTMMAGKYNIFQFKHPVIFKLYKSLKELAKEANEYYGLDFSARNYVIQGWANLEDIDDEGRELTYMENIFLHDHMNATGIPELHGYFSVYAEPSKTHYNVNKTDMTYVENKNGVAIMSETGHPHTRGYWNGGSEKKRRVTIAYDTLEVGSLDTDDEVLMGLDQHWVPLI